MPDSSQVHADQVAYWNGEGGARWVARQAHIDAIRRFKEAVAGLA